MASRRRNKAGWEATRVVFVAALILVFAGVASGAEPTPTLMASDAETVPVTSTGDAADDPTIWVNELDPAESRIIANDKKGALNMYRLDGTLVASIRTGTFWGNSDVRGDLLAVARSGIKLYTVSANSLAQVGSIKTSGEGLCMYHSSTTGPLPRTLASDTFSPLEAGRSKSGALSPTPIVMPLRCCIVAMPPGSPSRRMPAC